MIELNKLNKIPGKVKWYFLVKLIVITLVPSLVPSLVLVLVSKDFGRAMFMFFLFFVDLPIFIYLAIYYSILTFIVENDRITINSGVIFKRSKSIPFDKVQNVENVGGPLIRLFNLSKVNIWTSSPEQIQVHKKETEHEPDGRLELDSSDAEWFKNFILSKHS